MLVNIGTNPNRFDVMKVSNYLNTPKTHQNAHSGVLVVLLATGLGVLRSLIVERFDDARVYPGFLASF